MGSKRLRVCMFAMGTAFMLCFSAFADTPYRSSTEVDSVTDPYEADENIIEPEEVFQGPNYVNSDHMNAIDSVISCNDGEYLRLDILLEKSVTNARNYFYGFTLMYDDNFEQNFYYYPGPDTLTYTESTGGVESDTWDVDPEEDTYAGVTESGGKENSDIYVIIYKDDYFDGEYEDDFTVPARFFSGYEDATGKRFIDEKSAEVNLEFIR